MLTTRRLPGQYGERTADIGMTPEQMGRGVPHRRSYHQGADPGLLTASVLGPARASVRSLTVRERFQADRHHLEYVLAVHCLAVRNGQLIDGDKRVVDDTSQHADDQRLALITVGGNEAGDAAQVTRPAHSG